jgi:hypothetical protein
MDQEEIYKAWAPEGSIWSRWAAPALFAQTKLYSIEVNELGNPYSKLDWLPPPSENSAIIIDLPGANSVWMALAAARAGYRPVPIINACIGESSVVDMGNILEVVNGTTPIINSLSIPNDAPPAFLVDANRMTGTPRPGWFDNRWIVFPQDFPSAAFLSSQGITSTLIIQSTTGQPADDLAHILLRWQEGSIPMRVKSPNDSAPVQGLVITKPPRYKKFWYRALALIGLRRNSAGGFGDIVPDPNESSGFG